MQGEAEAAGGQVITLLGNHELMNLGGDYRYVAPGELAWLARNASDPATAGLPLCPSVVPSSATHVCELLII